MAPITLVLGGARSGKSAHAERLAADASPRRTYIATAQALDDEMATRIAHHKSRRDSSWQTVEAPLDLCGAIEAQATPDRVVLVDCLTLWLNNLLLANRNIEVEADGLIATLENAAGPLILVSNEVGLGIVPDNALARAFRDHAGRLNQRVAEAADKVVFLAAGLPMTLKG
ncbi:MAG: bifunctional adenosylcobinamide kinase/adenosylcobinamide-phosphate guanylyltransferase [Minwuiales bacterium]|nr:bifunctional adenosylcobinamide kinase/adenosylcobinamide-phosphate guanylyltransferase [Minwuiales bacterium]